MRNNWTFENCEERAQKYKRKIDFLKNDRLVYNAAYKKKWLIKICNHMEISGDKFNRCIYSYEFSDKTVYIGLTSNFNIRNIQHFNKSNKNNSVVKQYYNQIGILPVHKQLTDYIDYSDASKLEGEYLNLYKKDGWKILNKSKTGSLGASNLIYTKEKCKEILDNCIYLSDLYKHYARVLLICKKNNWYLDEIDSLVRHKNANKYWNKDKCIEVAKNTNSLQDFIKKYGSAYRSSLKNGWLDDLQLNSKKPKGYWTKEKCQIESLKYKNKDAFNKGSRGAYKSSYINKWLNEFF